MKVEKLRDLSRDEVMQKKTEIEEELFNLHLKKKTKQIQDTVRVRHLRRDRARIITILKEDADGIRALAEGGKMILDKQDKDNKE